MTLANGRAGLVAVQFDLDLDYVFHNLFPRQAIKFQRPQTQGDFNNQTTSLTGIYSVAPNFGQKEDIKSKVDALSRRDTAGSRRFQTDPSGNY
ncbi:hypothetical protein ElyMa_004605200 [Elysia marginata]|uniref:Uncharacterized protein n=1 Tax=Elysia marginata TaxID=1093978 RepID=A0AAV4HWS1_9GAST|nr:hypothetical protein ElyMa_004605200 [Elysia marginata]